MSKILGIIGGMGPLATVNLFNKIVINTDARSDQEHIHMLIDNNVNIPDRTAFLLGKGEDPTKELIKSATRLEKAGADFLIMPCNTAHHFYETIRENISIDFLNMIEETVRLIQLKYPNSKKVGLLSTKGTLKSKIYDLYFNKQNIQVINPEKETQDSIMDIIYGIKAGKREIQIDAIYSAVEEFKAKGVKVFVLGCTELSVVNEMFKLEEKFANAASSGNISDTADIANDTDVINSTDFIYAVDALNVIVRRAIEFAGKKVLNSSAKNNP